jgi:predicted transcriptional regulator
MSGSTQVRISVRSYRTLQALAKKREETLQALLDKAIESLNRQYFLEEANRGFAALKENQAAWEEELAERREWEDAMLGDEKET